MPKVGMEPVRRKALLNAALHAIGDQGSLSVTMSDIARRAGVSAALAHHYFGSKDHLMMETIRALLRDLRQATVAALDVCPHPREKVSALIRISFQADQFAAETVAAWLAFYSEAHRSTSMRRLLAIYARRLQSNLVANLTPLCAPADARHIAEGTAAMIDGLYLRRALGASPISAKASIALTDDYVTTQLKARTASRSSHRHPAPQETGQ